MPVLYDDFMRMCEVLDNPYFDPDRFNVMISSNNGCVIDNISIHRSAINSIRRFYMSTNDYNRSKIAELINNNIRNIKRVHKIVIDYEIVKENYEK